jgi:hypothetical protein
MLPEEILEIYFTVNLRWKKNRRKKYLERKIIERCLAKYIKKEIKSKNF